MPGFKVDSPPIAPVEGKPAITRVHGTAKGTGELTQRANSTKIQSGSGEIPRNSVEAISTPRNELSTSKTIKNEFPGQKIASEIEKYPPTPAATHSVALAREAPRRDQMGRYPPGVTGNPLGGPRLSVLRERLREHEERFLGQIEAGLSLSVDERNAPKWAELFASYLYGKATQAVELSTPEPLRSETRALVGVVQAQPEPGKLAAILKVLQSAGALPGMPVVKRSESFDMPTPFGSESQGAPEGSVDGEVVDSPAVTPPDEGGSEG